MKSFKTFLEESQTFVSSGFNIARSEMPQLNDIDAFIDHIERSGILALNIELRVDSLKPTQIEYDQAKVDSMIGKDLGRIVVSNDLFVLDGHHRYFAAAQSGVKTIKAVLVDTTINKLLNAAYAFLEGSSDG